MPRHHAERSDSRSNSGTSRHEFVSRPVNGDVPPAESADDNNCKTNVHVQNTHVLYTNISSPLDNSHMCSHENRGEKGNNVPVPTRQHTREQTLLDEIIPRIDLPTIASFDSNEIKYNNFTSTNDSGISLPEQILQQRLQRSKQHSQLRRYQSKSPEKRPRAEYTHDGSVASPPFSDDELESDNASTVASSNGASNNIISDLRGKLRLSDSDRFGDSTGSSPLASLPQRPICRFPDEADRKRIIGCLAVVLSCSYAHETAPQLLVKVANDMAVRIDDADVESVCEQKSPAFDTDADNGCARHDNDATSKVDWKGNNAFGIDSCGASIHPHLQPHKKQQHLIEQTRKQKNRSFRNNNSVTNSTSSFSLNTNAATRIFDKVGSQNPPPSLTLELAEIRHRIRRHTTLSELLISSAEMLLLDPSHAKAFLPMLDGLLTKVEAPIDYKSSQKSYNPNGTSRQSWKGRGFGGGGLNVASIREENESVPSLESAIQKTPFRMTKENKVTTASPISPTSELRMTEPDVDSLLRERLTDYSHKREAHQSINRDIIPASAINNVHCDPKLLANSYAPLDTAIIEPDLVAPFLQTLTPGAGFQCIALLLLNHLLRDGRGYDARVRHAFKRLSVIVISHELKVGGILCTNADQEEDLNTTLWSDKHTKTDGEDKYLNDADELALLATRKFEALEHAIAAKLMMLTREQDSGTQSVKTKSTNNKQSPRLKRSTSSASSLSSSTHGRIALAPKETAASSQYGVSREQLMRGIKVGTAGAVGATLFALTGGLAAPGIAAGLAAVVGTSAIAAGVSTALTSAAAITTIFGVGGAGLASYKMHRRTKGLTEFNFNKEAVVGKDSDAELFSTVCISGWLRDSRDFQRPWGVSPSHPRIVDKQELLERFYFVHNPENVFRVGEILKHWKGRYFQLWRALRQKYGRDPSNLFPLTAGPRISAELTHEEDEAVYFLLNELGYTYDKITFDKPPPLGAQIDQVVEFDVGSKFRGSNTWEIKKLYSAQQILKESSMRPKKWLPNGSEIASSLSIFSESESNSINDTSTHTLGSVTSTTSHGYKSTVDMGAASPPKHLLTVWDYHANYGGELYTVHWESELLMELCDSVTDQMIEWGISATRTILHTTVFATLMTAVTIPYSLVLAANTIDSSWTMAMERADRAGIELAKSLIDSIAGHRPVVLVGFSMGARVIYSCLKELAKHQEIWESHQQMKRLPKSSRRKVNNAHGEFRGEDQLEYVREPASIIEDVVLMGTPNHVSTKSWESCRRIVAGRMINCYSRKDYILSLMFQLKRFQGILRPVCGTSPVSVSGVENYDVTELISTHSDYCLMSGEILKRIRHGQPQRASEFRPDVAAYVTTIRIADKEVDGATLSQTKW